VPVVYDHAVFGWLPACDLRAFLYCGSLHCARQLSHSSRFVDSPAFVNSNTLLLPHFTQSESDSIAKGIVML
jgi:hypothetical protein